MANNSSSSVRDNSNLNHSDLDEVIPLVSTILVDTNRHNERTGGINEEAPLAELENFEEVDDSPTVSSPQPGVDDGFLGKPPISTNETDDIELHRFLPGKPLFSYAPGFGGGTDMEPIPDLNLYQQKKTVAQGMMDLALFSANANQLRYVLENSHHAYYYPGVVLISISLIFQVLVGIGLIWNTRFDVKDQNEIRLANKINNFTIVGIFLVTVINVFISAFGVASNSSSSATNTGVSENS